MNRTTSPTRRRSKFANQPEVIRQDEPALESPTGRADDQGADPGSASADEVRRPLGAKPRSAVTARHLSGEGANETVDGLSESEEMTRQSAEDIPTGRKLDNPDQPVFDRRDRLPKV